jgi:hypothetical protein
MGANSPETCRAKNKEGWSLQGRSKFVVALYRAKKFSVEAGLPMFRSKTLLPSTLNSNVFDQPGCVHLRRGWTQGSRFLRNVGNHLPYFTVTHPTKPAQPPLCKFQIRTVLVLISSRADSLKWSPGAWQTLCKFIELWMWLPSNQGNNMHRGYLRSDWKKYIDLLSHYRLQSVPGMNGWQGTKLENAVELTSDYTMNKWISERMNERMNE